MNLTQIFESEELSDKDKLGKITEIITSARNAYGNSEADITLPAVNTVDGLTDLNMLSSESRVVIAQSEVSTIKVIASEFVKCVEGANYAKKVEELIATNPVLAHITSAMPENDYL